MKKPLTSIIAFFLILNLIQIAYCPNLALTIQTNRELYRFGDTVFINGNLTHDGSPYSAGLVAIEVDDPQNNTYIIRTRPTGTNINAQWAVNITSMFTCDAQGHPKTTFSPGGEVGLKMTIKNNAGTSQNVTVYLSPHYSDGTPFKNASIFWGPYVLEPYQTITYMSGSALIIPLDAVLGTATIYVSVLTDLPRNNGYAYSPEKAITFNITTGGSTAPIPTFTDGTFNMTFKFHNTRVKVGNYTVYARARMTEFPYLFANAQTTFYVVLISDLNKDKKVDMKDVAIVAKAFGSEPGDPNWNPIADITGPEYLVPDGKVDMRDISVVAKDFGKVGT